MRGSFPHFLVLGAPKAGTTALCNYLAGHPQLRLSQPKETRFFHRDNEPEIEVLWRRHFGAETERLCGEGTPTSLGLPYVLRRISRAAPQARLFVLLRDPATRAFSSWWMRRCFAQEPLDFAQAVEVCRAQPPLSQLLKDRPGQAYQEIRQGLRSGRPGYRGYLHYGLYGPQLEFLLTLFERPQVCLIWSDSLKQRPAREVGRALEFLGVDPSLRRGHLRPHWQAYGPRFAALSAFLSRRGWRRVLGWRGMRLLEMLFRFLGDRAPRITGAMHEFLLDYFKESDSRLQELWGQPPVWRLSP